MVLSLGRYQLHAVTDGSFALDGGAMFGVVPKPLWEKQLPADARNRVPLALRCLLVVDTQSDRRLLVDCGAGDKWDAKRRDIYDLGRGPRLDHGLAAAGVRREEITDVVITHLHFDHCGGLTRADPAGALECSFPNAKVHVQRRNWFWAQRPSEKDKGSYLQSDFELIHGRGHLHLLEGETELWPDVEVLVSEGHTVGMQLVRVHGDDRHLTFCADLLPTHLHVKPAWIMAYDLYPLTTLEEKKMLLAQTLEEDGILFFEHDAQLAAGRLTERDGLPAFAQAVEI